MTATTNQNTDEPATERPSVLVVDDEERLADLYAHWLDGRYDVTAVYGGEAALATVDASVDVVLLDRRMPETTGDDVLEGIRRRNLDCRVAMVTAVDPDLDLIEMPFDDYLTKPASADELESTVERLLLRAELDDVEYELSSLQVKRNVLVAEMGETNLQDSEEFATLERRIRALRTRLSDLRTRLEEEPPARSTV
jgi:two-component system response regulator AdeR